MNPALAQSSLLQAPDALPLAAPLARSAARGCFVERQASPAPRNGQVLPIGDILPDVLRRYDLPLPAVTGPARAQPNR